MRNIVFMSIKEEHINRIISRVKNHEFRTKIPKNEIEYIIVYVPTPIKELKYILKVKKVVSTPNKIDEKGIGNKQFNVETKEKYAYPIENLYEINKAIGLKQLKEKFYFTAPQSFAYGNKYKELLNYIEKIGIKRIY